MFAVLAFLLLLHQTFCLFVLALFPSDLQEGFGFVARVVSLVLLFALVLES